MGDQEPIRGLGGKYKPMRVEETLPALSGGGGRTHNTLLPSLYFSLVKNSLDVLQQKSNDELISNLVEIEILYIIFNFSHVDIFVDFVYSVFYNTKA